MYLANTSPSSPQILCCLSVYSSVMKSTHFQFLKKKIQRCIYAVLFTFDVFLLDKRKKTSALSKLMQCFSGG